ARWPVPQCVLELTAHELGLGLDVEAGQYEGHLVAVAAQRVHADLEVRRRRFPGDTADPNPVATVRCELDRVESGRDVRARIAWPRHLIHELRGHGSGRDRSAGPFMLGDDTRAVRMNLGDRKSGVVNRVFTEEGVVSPCGLGTTLDHVPRGDGPGQCIVVVTRPAEMGGSRAA